METIDILLNRFPNHENSKETIGSLCVYNGKKLIYHCTTLENKEHQIPTGIYHCYTNYSNRFDRTMLHIMVKNRTHIMFHHGNTIDDSSGCILLGSVYDKILHNSYYPTMLFNDILVNKQFNINLKITQNA